MAEEVERSENGATQDPPEVSRRFWAFVSYSREDNRPGRLDSDGNRTAAWGDWLQEQLETYVLPEGLVGKRNHFGEVLPARPFPIFRDEEDMGANGNLSLTIRRGLEQARCLVVICSPRSARSKWVNEEVRTFKQLGRAARIIPVIIAGEPGASIGDKVRAPASEECFVPALLHPLGPNGQEDLTTPDSNLPLGSDFRWGDDKREICWEDFSEASTVLQHAKLHLLSGIIGVDLDDLVQRDKVRQLAEAQQRARRARKLIFGFASLAVVAVLGAGVAVWQRQIAQDRQIEAQRQEGLAIQQRHIAQDRQLEAQRQEGLAKAEASQSEYLRGCDLIASGDADEALLSLSRAVELRPGNREALTRLINLLGQRTWPLRVAALKHVFPVKYLKANPDGSRLFVGNDLGSSQNSVEAMHVWDTTTLRMIGLTPIQWGSGFYQMEVSPTGNRVLFTHGYKRPGGGGIVDAKTGKLLAGEGPNLNISQCAFSTDGKFCIEWTMAGATLQIFSADAGKLVAKAELDDVKAENDDASTEPAQAPADRERDSDDERNDSSILAADVRDGKVFVVTADGVLTAFPLSDPGHQEHKFLKLSGLTYDKGASLTWAAFDPSNEIVHGIAGGAVGQWEFSGGAAIYASLPDSNRMSGESHIDGIIEPERQVTIVRQGEENAVVARVKPSDEENGTSSSLSLLESRRLPLTSVCALPTHQILGSEGIKAYLFDFEGGPSGPFRHDDEISRMCMIREGLVATGSQDGDVRFWAFAAPAISPEVIEPSEPAEKKARPDAADSDEQEDGTELLQTSADGSLELSDGDGLWIRKTQTGERVKVDTAARGQEGVEDARLAPDGKVGVFAAYRGTSSGGADYGACVFDTNDGSVLSPLLAHFGCDAATFTADSKQVITVGNGQIVFWDRQDFVRTGRILAHSGVTGVSVHENGLLMVSWTAGGEAIVWDARTWTRRLSLVPDRLWSFGPSDDTPFSLMQARRPVSMTRDARRLAIGYNDCFVIWDLGSGKPLCDPIVCPSRVQTLRFIEGRENACEATLDDGIRVRWQFTDIPSSLAPSDLNELLSLARSVAGGQWKQWGRSNSSPSPGGLVRKLKEHFASVTVNVSRVAFDDHPDGISSEAVVELHLQAAETLSGSLQLGQIVTGLRSVARLDPKNGPARVEATVAKWGRDGWKKLEDELAGEAWKWPAEAPPDADATSDDEFGVELQGVLEMHPKDGAALAGLCFWEKRKPEEPIEEEQKDKNEDSAEKALEAREKRADELSLADFQNAPGDSVVAWRRGRALAALGRLDEARAVLGKALETTPTHAGICQTAAAVDLALKQPAAALQALDRAASDDDETALVKIRKAKVLASLNQPAKALETLQAVLPAELDASDLIYAGDALWGNRNKKEALKYWELCSKTREGVARVAAAYWQQGEQARALKLLATGDYTSETVVPNDLKAAWKKCYDAAMKSEE